MKNRFLYHLAVICGFCLVLASCKPPSVSTGLPGVSAKELAESIVERARPFQAEGILRFEGGLLSFAECEFSCDPKLGMRIDLYTPFGTPAAVFALRGDHAEFLSIIEGLLVRGRAKDLTSRIFNLDVDPGGLPWILAGGLPANLTNWRYESLEKNISGMVLLTAQDEAGHDFHAVLQGKDYRVTEISVYGPDGGDPLQRIECDDHLPGGAPIPRRLSLSGPAPENEFQIILRDIKIGKGPGKDELTLEGMPGIRVQDL